MTKLIIEICPYEPRATACLANGCEIAADETVAADMADCRASGDVEPACQYVLDEHEPEFRIVARNATGDYENRLATDSEMQETCEAIYFDNEPGEFTGRNKCALYLVWEAASQESPD